VRIMMSVCADPVLASTSDIFTGRNKSSLESAADAWSFDFQSLWDEFEGSSSEDSLSDSVEDHHFGSPGDRSDSSNDFPSNIDDINVRTPVVRKVIRSPRI